MGPIPNFPITPWVGAFIIAEMYYFGPMSVPTGRSREKRYGFILTCMSTRTIHFDITSSLKTDSAII